MSKGLTEQDRIQPASAGIWLSWVQDALVLRRRALRLTRGNREEAEDLLSSTLIKAVSHVERHQTEIREPRAFLLFAMKNEHISRIRKQTSERQVRDFKADVYEDHAHGLSDSEPDQEQQLRHQEALRRVLQAVQRMPAEFRQVFYMRFCDECSYREIARKLRISEALARKRVQHLREHLRAEMEDLEGGAWRPGYGLSQAFG
ncbi:RNA polymerase sigma-70 factor (ECF subfamily) [Roseibium hamelinense]|uniref:RNA polymerase sigma-70 factor (ECF subfamily) n=1 Tax=Roseibium hamelinense TaxID=150831 RepID=A0A562T9G2_9HYPH|nr:RNA polymerase sigma factor [Roseibium hamelinense]MTI45352.1 RNA polymerase sigma factor [Roseibium hamelinense]TWI90281.1 RNA polymerase sigma-70 factor (ECF subfamily) [Roseibium hamelinense]